MRQANTCGLAWVAGRVCLFLVLSQGWVHAVVLDTQGEYHFGPETSRNQACHLAAERAKFNALSLVVGEQISSEEKLSCQQSSARDSTASCEMNKNTWSFLDGNIRTAEKVSETVKVLDGASVCKVTMVVDIANPKVKTNPYFDVKVSLNKKNYREGEAMQIELQPSAPMYISIFAWYPHLDGENMVQIFPNSFDTHNNQPLVDHLLAVGVGRLPKGLQTIRLLGLVAGYEGEVRYEVVGIKRVGEYLNHVFPV